MIAYRVKYLNIISELFLPEKHNGKTLIFLQGLPSSNSGKNFFTEALVNKGYVVFYPFYTGSYDSAGYFSPKQCIRDVKKFIKMAWQNKYRELYFDKVLITKTQEIILAGTSFGSSISLLNAEIPEIKKLLLIAPVLSYVTKDYKPYGVDFSFQMKSTLALLTRGYKNSYRIKDKKQWINFLIENRPATRLPQIEKPVFLLQGVFDPMIPWKLTRELFNKYHRDKYHKLKIVKNANHSVASFNTPVIIKEIFCFLK